jgi:UV excision repair protein RAD23
MNPPTTQASQPINLFEAAARATAAQRGGAGGQAARPGAVPAQAQPAATPTAAPAGAGMSLEQLRDNPQFQQLRGIVQSNPHLLEPIIQNIAQGNPQLAALINQNPEQFLQMLAEGQEGGGMPGMAAIQITPEEREAIGRVPPLPLYLGLFGG